MRGTKSGLPVLPERLGSEESGMPGMHREAQQIAPSRQPGALRCELQLQRQPWRKDMKRKTPEGYVKSAVLEYLAMKHIYALRVNSGSVLGNTNGRKWCVKMAPKGTADILALEPGLLVGTDSDYQEKVFTPIWIETKAPKKGPTEQQLDFKREVEEMGHVYLVARSMDDVRDFIEKGILPVLGKTA
jgi:hypothetical protein